MCGVSTSAIDRPPVDIVERNHAQVTCLTRSRRPTLDVVLPDSSCFATPGFGDVLSVEDILVTQILEGWIQTARKMITGVVLFTSKERQ